MRLPGPHPGLSGLALGRCPDSQLPYPDRVRRASVALCAPELDVDVIRRFALGHTWRNHAVSVLAMAWIMKEFLALFLVFTHTVY